jgi:hypothetical protein
VIEGQPPGFHRASTLRSGPPGFQTGRGAVALVFDRGAVMTLLSSPHLVERFGDVHRGHKAIDGGIVTALNHQGVFEYVHNPSLVQHTGETSTMGNRTGKLALSFPGEDRDALALLRKQEVTA